jgi:hypothetical protein
VIKNLLPAEYDAILRSDPGYFAERCFRELNPQSAFLPNWHIEVIAAKLAAVRAGKIRRLIINKAYKIDIIAFIFHPAVPRRARCVSGWQQGGMSTQCSGALP